MAERLHTCLYSVVAFTCAWSVLYALQRVKEDAVLLTVKV